MEWVRNLVQRGQELGAIRDDLPEDLLQSLIMTFDNVHDRWLAEHDRDINSSVEGTGRNRAGLGIYYIEEPYEDENS